MNSSCASVALSNTASSASTSTPLVLMRGFLHKRSPKNFLSVTIDQRRWFVLSATFDASGRQTSCLHWSKSATSIQACGSLAVASMDTIEPSSDHDTLRLTISLRSSVRIYSLRVTNAMELSQWLNALKKAQRDEGYVGRQHVVPSMNMAHLMNIASTPSPHDVETRDSSASDANDNMSPQKCLEQLITGVQVGVVSALNASQVQYEESLLSLDPSFGSLGALEWRPLKTNPHLQERGEKHRLPLSAMRELFLGRRSRAWSLAERHLSTIEAERCFTALASVHDVVISLNVIGENVAITTAILTAIEHHITRHGKKRLSVTEKIPSTTVHMDKSATASARSSLSSTSSASTNDLCTIKISDWLSALGAVYVTYAPAFIANGVDLTMASEIDDEDLVELGVSSALHRKRLLLGFKQILECDVTPTHFAENVYVNRGELSRRSSTIDHLLSSKRWSLIENQELAR